MQEMLQQKQSAHLISGAHPIWKMSGRIWEVHKTTAAAAAAAQNTLVHSQRTVSREPKSLNRN
jgi:hypothetical protein